MTDATVYIGLMSGTSLDAVDAVAVRFAQDSFDLIGSYSQLMPEHLRTDILELCEAKQGSLKTLTETDHLLGKLYSATTLKLIETVGLNSSQVAAIGCHGQTVRHIAPGKEEIPTSLQIGDANILCADTGIPVVADFRRKDLALDGQGAPLVPAFHREIFASKLKNRVILNIGGIANITVLAKEGGCFGFDTGPGNMLMDIWSQTHLGKAYDQEGSWAARGSINGTLLTQLKACDFFSQPAPKSTGRELFNQQWLNKQLSAFTQIPSEDVQATLLALTTQTICDAINGLDIAIEEVYVCGGGAFNSTLMGALEATLPEATVATTEALGLGPSWIEACAFAWLAKQRLEGKPGNVTAVTGALRETVLGALYLP